MYFTHTHTPPHKSFEPSFKSSPWPRCTEEKKFRQEGKIPTLQSYDSSFCCSSHHWRDQLLFYTKPCHFSRETANEISCIHGCKPTSHARPLNSPNKKEAIWTHKKSTRTYYLIRIWEWNLYLCANGNAFWVASALDSEFCVTSGIVLSSSVPLMLSGVRGDWISPADSFKKKEWLHISCLYNIVSIYQIKCYSYQIYCRS